jgi:hypothetical protein
VTIQSPVTAICDRCRATTSGLLLTDRLLPTVAMHLQLPAGWSVSAKPDSGELYVLCAACPPDSTSLAPPPVVVGLSNLETDPTVRPPPPKPEGR